MNPTQKAEFVGVLRCIPEDLLCLVADVGDALVQGSLSRNDIDFAAGRLFAGDEPHRVPGDLLGLSRKRRSAERCAA